MLRSAWDGRKEGGNRTGEKNEDAPSLKIDDLRPYFHHHPILLGIRKSSAISSLLEYY